MICVSCNSNSLPGLTEGGTDTGRVITTVGAPATTERAPSTDLPPLTPNVGGVRISAGQSVIYDSLNYALMQSYSAESGGVYITLDNDTEEEKEVVFYISSDGFKVLESEKASVSANTVRIKVGAKEKESFKLNLIKGSVSGIAVVGKDMHIYEKEALSVLLSASGAKQVYFRNALSFETLKIDTPCKLSSLAGRVEITDALIYESELEGSFEIGEGIAVNKLYANAPLSDILCASEIAGLADDLNYYLYARSYNGSFIDNSRINIFTKEQLYSLCDSGSYPKLRDGLTIVLKGNFELGKEQLTVGALCSFVIEGNVSTELPVRVSTQSEGRIKISVSENSTLTTGAGMLFEVHAPKCALLWSDRFAPSVSSVITKMNVKSYNGILLSQAELGGDGDGRVEHFYMRMRKNGGLSADIKWVQDGYYLYAIVSSVTDKRALERAVLDIEVSRGCSFSISNGAVNFDSSIDLFSSNGCVLTVTDANGKTFAYSVVTEYVANPLPIISINTQNGALIESTDTYVSGDFTMDCDHINSAFSMNTVEILIRGRGHSSWSWEKKPYQIKFLTKKSVLGLASAKKWVLLANYADKSLIRNYTAFEMARVLDNLAYTPTTYPVDVFLNGEYIGIYSIGERIEAKTGRVELADNGSAVDTGYMVEIGGTATGDTYGVNWFHSTMLKHLKIKCPDDQEVTKEQCTYIYDYFAAAENAIKKNLNYEDYIDIGALIDWQIMNEIAYNIDCCFRRSCYITKNAGGKLTLGPIWDFDLAFGNMWADKNKYDEWVCIGTNEVVPENWLTYLMKYDEYREAFRARWEEVKDELLATAMEAIDEMSAKVTPSAKYNFTRWDILNDRVAYEPSFVTKYNTYELQIEYLKDFINSRWQFLDENI